MLSLDARKLANTSISVGTGWLLGSCMEARGKQDLWMKQKPEVLAALREQAIIQSVESSNRIEGVTIPADRLRPIVLGRAKPRDRSEEEQGPTMGRDVIRAERQAVQRVAHEPSGQPDRGRCLFGVSRLRAVRRVRQVHDRGRADVQASIPYLGGAGRHPAASGAGEDVCGLRRWPVKPVFESGYDLRNRRDPHGTFDTLWRGLLDL